MGVELPCEFYEVVRVAYQSKNFVHAKGLESRKAISARRVIWNFYSFHIQIEMKSVTSTPYREDVLSGFQVCIASILK